MVASGIGKTVNTFKSSQVLSSTPSKAQREHSFDTKKTIDSQVTFMGKKAMSTPTHGKVFRRESTEIEIRSVKKITIEQKEELNDYGNDFKDQGELENI